MKRVRMKNRLLENRVGIKMLIMAKVIVKIKKKPLLAAVPVIASKIAIETTVIT